MNGRLMVGAALLMALLGGCTGPGPAAAPEEAPPAAQAQAEEGATATLIRVVPRGHAIDWSAYQVAEACQPVGADPCRDALVQFGPATVGMTYEDPEWTVDDPEALFWRFDAEVVWTTDNPAITEAKLEVLTRRPCGDGCWEERSVDERTGPSPLAIERRDIYLEEGETGLLVRLTSLQGSTPAPGFGVRFETTGNADGYVAAGDPPIVVSPTA